MTDRPPEPDASLLDDLVAANHVLYAKGIVDGLGHVSVRHDKDPSMYLLAAERAPALVTEGRPRDLRSRQQRADAQGAPRLYRALHSRRDLQGAAGRDVGDPLSHAVAGDVLRLPGAAAAALSHERLSRSRRRPLRGPRSLRHDRHAGVVAGHGTRTRQVARRPRRRADARPRRDHGRRLDQAHGVPRDLHRAQRDHADGRDAPRRRDLSVGRGSRQDHGDQRPRRRSLMGVVEGRGGRRNRNVQTSSGLST